MNCPPEIAEALVGILQMGILRIRASGWAGDANRCAIEADHIHNLPDILANFSFDRLKYYWEFERPYFLRRSEAEGARVFETWWGKLESCLSREPARAGD